jgi:hypothetical protein
MQKKESKNHPEVTTTKNICDITPGNKYTRDVCHQIKKNKGISENHPKSRK